MLLCFPVPNKAILLKIFESTLISQEKVKSAMDNPVEMPLEFPIGS